MKPCGEVRIERTLGLPDELRVSRSRRAPELGPRILFLTGGTALRPLSQTLKRYTHNSIHLVTPFDSGGSSARLREAFHMLSVGDLRNRLMALADETVRGNPEIYRLFAYRLPSGDPPPALLQQLAAFASGADPRVASVPEPLRQIVRTQLRFFCEAIPHDFDLRGASIGNLILAGGYLSNERRIDSVLFLFSKLVEVRGRVLPTAEADLHLAADLRDGTRVVGQHGLTGKETPPIGSPIEDFYLVDSLVRPTRTAARATDRALRRLKEADVICYAMGSFYSSVLANLLPAGVGSAIRGADCPKVYIPNTGEDPEQLGMSIADAVERIAHCVRRDAGEDTHMADILTCVLVDTRSGVYSTPLDAVRLKELGVQVVDMPLVTRRSRPWLDPERLSQVLISLA